MGAWRFRSIEIDPILRQTRPACNPHCSEALCPPFAKGERELEIAASD
jgi:hypothetical protein